jgi:cell division septation protein DedD
VDTKTILIISEYPADFYTLTSALERAVPPRFKTVTVNPRDHPVDALMDPGNAAVILAYTLETEYLLRLAQKNALSLPVLVLIDPEAEDQVKRLKEAGATDYIVRGLINDDMLHRVLDYSIVLNHVTRQHEQVVQQQRIERAAQQRSQRLQTVAEVAGNGDVFQQPHVAPDARPGNNSVATPGMANPETAVTSAPANPASVTGSWKSSILVVAIAVLMLTAGFFSQRLDNESRLSRLEASNDVLSQQVLRLHSDLTLTALAAAPPQVEAKPLAAPSPGPDTAAALEEEPATAAAAKNPDSESAAVEITSTGERSPVTAPSLTPPEPAVTPIGPTAGGSWFINLGTFSSSNAARRFANSLSSATREPVVHPVTIGARTLYRVRVDNLRSEEAAEALAMDYQIKLGGSRPWVGQE